MQIIYIFLAEKEALAEEEIFWGKKTFLAVNKVLRKKT